MRTDPTFWLLARAAGLTAYLLLTASVVAGLILKGRFFGRSVRAATIADIHKSLAVAGIGALAVHAIALLLDTTVRVSPLALLVPGLVDYRTAWVSVGVVAAELMVIVTASFWLRKWIGTRMWRRLHWLAYAVFVSGTAHGLLAGSDAGRLWAQALYATAVGSVAAATAWRALARPETRPARAAPRGPDRDSHRLAA